MTCEGEKVSEGCGADCLGHPVNAVVWLANTLAALGRPLEAGHVVLSGALGPMVSVGGPGQYEAVLGGLGSVRATFTRDQT
jgi:2-keto-4-pentenoate hydratase